MRTIKHKAGDAFGWIADGFSLVKKKTGFLVGTYLFTVLILAITTIIYVILRAIGMFSGSVGMALIMSVLGTLVFTTGSLFGSLFTYSGMKQADTQTTPEFGNNFAVFKSPTGGIVWKISVLEFLVGIVFVSRSAALTANPPADLPGNPAANGPADSLSNPSADSSAKTTDDRNLLK